MKAEESDGCLGLAILLTAACVVITGFIVAYVGLHFIAKWW